MEKKLLSFCKFYHGEKSNPLNDDRAIFWEYERKWVEFNTTEEGKNSLSSFLEFYVSCGLAMFSIDDDTPASLKALLFNRYAHWSSLPMLELADGFKDFYKQYKNLARN